MWNASNVGVELAFICAAHSAKYDAMLDSNSEFDSGYWLGRSRQALHKRGNLNNELRVTQLKERLQTACTKTLLKPITKTRKVNYGKKAFK